MRSDDNKYNTILLVILIIIVLILTVFMGYWYFHRDRGEGSGVFWNYTNSNDVVYRGEIYPENLKTRTEQVNSMPKTTIQFYESKYDFGSVAEGVVLKHSFRFKNTGSNPLMIAKADVTCGCTVPEFPSDAISPGSDGELTVVYNTTGKNGVQRKEIAVHANTNPESVTILIEADVR